jgi:hypothetical protein
MERLKIFLVKLCQLGYGTTWSHLLLVGVVVVAVLVGLGVEVGLVEGDLMAVLAVEVALEEDTEMVHVQESIVKVADGQERLIMASVVVGLQNLLHSEEALDGEEDQMGGAAALTTLDQHILEAPGEWITVLVYQSIVQLEVFK